MTATSFDRLLRSSRLAIPATGDDDVRADHSIRLTRPDRERLEGKVKGGRAKSGGASPVAASLSRGMDRRMSSRAFGGNAQGAHMAFDQRQRAIVKVHYFNHSGGDGGALKAHVRYVARDAATRDDLSNHARGEERSETREDKSQARAHAAYLSREGGAERSVFYDARAEGVDGAAYAEAWAKADRRHFRIVLSAENGDHLHDLPAYTREVMARAETALGAKLQWVAVDHHDTDNPHTHLIIRGRRANGQDLVLPRDFIKYGFASIARDVATESLGARTLADERFALDREAKRHGPTRLDRMLALQVGDDGALRLADIVCPRGGPHTTRALKARAQELMRMGLAREMKRNVLSFEPDWRDRLHAMELHLDIRKRVVRERALQRTIPDKAVETLARGLLGR